MGRITLKRTGNAPLSIIAEFVDSWSTLDYAGERRGAERRWHTLTLHRAADGRWVVHAGYHSTWRDELPHYDAWVGDANELAGWLTGYNPTLHVVGYRGLRGYEGRQERLLVTLRQRWDAIVSAALDRPEFREEVGSDGS